jgi:hypothetical protein
MRPGRQFQETGATRALPDRGRAVIASQIVAVERAFLAERVGKLVPKDLAQVMSGVDIVLGR